MEDRIDSMSAFERVKLARHLERPYTLDFVERLFEEFVEVKGDRRYAEDPAIVCGFARYRGVPVGVVGQQKGRDAKQRRYRKFGRPVVTFIDTQGAYPGIDAEERGQAEAIARNLFEMSRLRVPVVGVVIGEGGSGGALAIGVADQVLMLENAVYSVITPEGCAAILFKDSAQAPRAAEFLRLTAPELYRAGLVDLVIPEPAGGAQNDYDETARLLDAALWGRLRQTSALPAAERLARRYKKLRALGSWQETLS